MTTNGGSNGPSNGSLQQKDATPNTTSPDLLDLWRIRSRAMLVAAVTELDVHATPWSRDLLREMAKAIQNVFALYLQIKWAKENIYTMQVIPNVELSVRFPDEYKAYNTVAAVDGSKAVAGRPMEPTFVFAVQAPPPPGGATQASPDTLITILFECRIRGKDTGNPKETFAAAVQLCDDEINGRADISDRNKFILARDGFGKSMPIEQSDMLWDLRVRFTLFLWRFCRRYRDSLGEPPDDWTVFFLRPRRLHAVNRGLIRGWGSGMAGYRYALDHGQTERIASHRVLRENAELQSILHDPDRANELFIHYPEGMCGEVYWKGRAVTMPRDLDRIQYPEGSTGPEVKAFEEVILQKRQLMEIPVHFEGPLVGEEVVDGPAVIMTVAIARHDCTPSTDHSELDITRAEAGVIAEMAQRLLYRYVNVQPLSYRTGPALEDGQSLERDLRRWTHYREPIVLLGPSGSGKTTFAKELHDRSKLPIDKFIELNCATLSGDRVEVELFGCLKGAYTNAPPEGREGRLKAADGGTLFLDEVHHLPHATQALLLKFLDDGQICPAGSDRPLEKRLKVRLIVASNLTRSEIEAEQPAARQRRFKPPLLRDFWFRINSAIVTIPRFAERSSAEKEEFIKKSCEALWEDYRARKLVDKKAPIPRFSDEAKSFLMERDFDGNFREVRSLIARAVHRALFDGQGNSQPIKIGKEYFVDGEFA